MSDVQLMHYVYVLRSLKDSGFYIGYSANLRKRFSEHVTGGSLRRPGKRRTSCVRDGAVANIRVAPAHFAPYLEYNSTMSCSFTMGCISSREGMCETLPLRASRSAVSQSGTGTICVRSRFRSTN